MKKINAKFSQKDRVICVTEQDTHKFCAAKQGTHKFYYKLAGSKERTLLFASDFSPSVLDYFRSKGRETDENEYEITLRELYAFKNFRNHKLSKLMERIPMMIEYVIHEYLTSEEKSTAKVICRKKKAIRKNIDDAELAA